MNPLIQFCKVSSPLMMPLALVCSAFLTSVDAVVPPPDGGYPGFTTAEGTKALQNLTSGAGNTGVGWYSLFGDTSASFNTALGAGTLVLNNGDSNTAVGAAALLLNAASGNTAIGSRALLNNTTGGTLGNIQGIDVGPNVAVGWQALESNTVASANTAVGYQALHSFTTGPMGLEQVALCTAVGFQALANATGNGFGNSGFGYQALMNNTDGALNTAVGVQALFNNNIGGENTAVGASTLAQNTTGDQNTAIGKGALSLNDVGSQNTALGGDALSFNTDGSQNTATGYQALLLNTGSGNTANGFEALTNNTSGTSNTAVGYHALVTNSTGQSNTALGTEAGDAVTGSGNVCIGQGVPGEAGVDDRTYIRNVNTLLHNFCAGVNDYVTVRLSDGRLGHTAVVSSRRYKEDINPLANTSDALYALKPLSFRLKKQYDETQALGFRLIAEEVAEVSPDLVYRNVKGQVESVRYEMVNAMLLNEFLKEHRTVQKQQKQIDAFEKELKEQRALIRQVSAYIELSKSSARTALNDP
jgi:hypothetical protein